MMPLTVVDSNENKLDVILDEEIRRIIVIKFRKMIQDTNKLLNVFKENTNKWQPVIRKAIQDIEGGCVGWRDISV